MSKALYTTFPPFCNYGNSVRLKRSSVRGGAQGRVTYLCQVAGIAPLAGGCGHLRFRFCTIYAASAD